MTVAFHKYFKKLPGIKYFLSEVKKIQEKV